MERALLPFIEGQVGDKEKILVALCMRAGDAGAKEQRGGGGKGLAARGERSGKFTDPLWRKESRASVELERRDSCFAFGAGLRQGRKEQTRGAA